MKEQQKSSNQEGFSPAALQALRSGYRELDRAVDQQPWLVQGSVNVVAPKSPAGSETYTWTRKVQAKTVTIALSARQAVAFRQAIAANRRIEAALKQVREVSQTALLTAVPGVTKRRSDGPQDRQHKSSQRGLK